MRRGVSLSGCRSCSASRRSPMTGARGATRTFHPRFCRLWSWITRPDHRRAPGSPRPRLAQEIRRPIEQMLRLVVPGFVGTRRPVLPEPFIDRVPDFFAYLRDERGLRAATIWQYTHHLRQLAVYLRERGLCDLRALSPVVISGFLTDRGRHFSRSSVRSRCVVLRVFLRYLHREGLVARDLSHTVDSPRVYRLATVPRSIEWGRGSAHAGGRGSAPTPSVSRSIGSCRNWAWSFPTVLSARGYTTCGMRSRPARCCAGTGTGSTPAPGCCRSPLFSDTWIRRPPPSISR